MPCSASTPDFSIVIGAGGGVAVWVTAGTRAGLGTGVEGAGVVFFGSGFGSGSGFRSGFGSGFGSFFGVADLAGAAFGGVGF